MNAQLFDVEKCFDALWVEECINDVFEAGLDNDKLVLLYLENQNANIAIKTPEGKSDRTNIKKHHHAGYSVGELSMYSYNGPAWQVCVQQSRVHI